MVITLVLAAAMLTAIGVVRVSRQHEVLRLGFQLSRTSETLGKLHEHQRQLELELATLAAPDRIRRLATQLGMTPVSPDRIRVVHARVRAADATPPTSRAGARPGDRP